MLACARLGAIHSVVFGGFGADELAARVEDSGARVILCASCGIGPGGVTPYKPFVDRALELLGGERRRCVVLQRPEGSAALVPGRDIERNEFLDGAAPAECGSVASTDPLYILYTSGTLQQARQPHAALRADEAPHRQVIVRGDDSSKRSSAGHTQILVSNGRGFERLHRLFLVIWLVASIVQAWGRKPRVN
jgi:hypothetical protein